jgi:hypothetical protein
MIGSLCFNCKFCKSIDVYGNVDCELYIGVRFPKVYCKNFQPKDLKKREKQK